MATRVATITSVNPANEEVLQTYDLHTASQVDAALAGAQDAFVAWRARPFAERAVPMRNLAKILRERAADYSTLMSREMGKPISEAKAEIEKCAWGCEFYAENAAGFLGGETIPSSARKSYVRFDPLGIVLAVMPWNFPFWQVIRFAAPALMAGNAAILKHASNVPGCALAIEEAIRDAGFPEGLFRTLLISGPQAEALIADERIRAVTLTGSSVTGSKIAAAAGRALKKTVLELGGSDPFIVLADADLAGAATTAVRARNQNTGQSCIAAKRFIVEDDVAIDFEQRFKKGVEALVMGDPLDPKTQVGPLARADLRDALESQVARSLRMGARLVTGGKRWGEHGFYYAPTILADVTPDMPVFREETFGPVAALMSVRDADEAVAVANDTEYGLGANLWTSNIDRAEQLAPRIESGQVFVNGMVASDPRLPFGGVKHSGYGRELSAYGIKEFTDIKTVWIGPAQNAQPTPPSE